MLTFMELTGYISEQFLKQQHEKVSAMTEEVLVGIILLILALIGAAVPSIAKVIDGGVSIDSGLDQIICYRTL
ncbi:MAG TPA: hypothetical protein VKP65_18805 [Rhodothermales bacterium]|nr:hypothetical protein [Rhodothermales bacterium]